MFCTTECWICEDKKCKHYVSKQDLYFENKKLKDTLKEIREYMEANKDSHIYETYYNEVEYTFKDLTIYDELLEIIDNGIGEDKK